MQFMSDIMSNYNVVYERLQIGVDPDSRPELLADENSYLSPYLSAMASRHGIGESSLRELFNLQAERTGAFVTSRFSILPQQDFKKFSSDESPNFSAFSVDNLIRGKFLGFGFIQHFNASKTFAVPVLALSDDIVEMASSYDSEKLLSAIGELYSYANHDYMHHLAPESVSTTVVKRHTLRKSSMNKLLHHDGYFNSCKKTSPESFFLSTHLHNFQKAYTDNASLAEAYEACCKKILSETARISDLILCEPGGIKSEKRANEFVNYIGNLGLFGMARICDIANDKIALDFADRIGEIDPLPGYIPGRKSLLNPFGRASTKDRKAVKPDEIRDARIAEVFSLSDRISFLTLERREGRMPSDKMHLFMEQRFLKAIEEDVLYAFGPNALNPG